MIRSAVGEGRPGEAAPKWSLRRAVSLGQHAWTGSSWCARGRTRQTRRAASGCRAGCARCGLCRRSRCCRDTGWPRRRGAGRCRTRSGRVRSRPGWPQLTCGRRRGRSPAGGAARGRARAPRRAAGGTPVGPGWGWRVRSAGSASRMRSVSRRAELSASPSRSSWGRRGGAGEARMPVLSSWSTKLSRMRRPFLPRMSVSKAPMRTPRRSITLCAWLRRANSFRRMAAPGSQIAERLGGNEARPARTRTGAPAPGGGCPRHRSSVGRNCSTAAVGTGNFMLRGGHAPRGHDGLDRIRRESGGGGF